MTCPQCGAEITQGSVVNSRHSPDGSIRRRRICPSGHRFTTYERTEQCEREVFPNTTRATAKKLRELAEEIAA